MNNKNLEQKTKLVEGLPAIYHDNRWIIYSPYAKKIATFEDLKDEERIKNKLEKEDFFGSPKTSGGSEELSRVILITTKLCNLDCKYCYETKNGTEDVVMSKKMAKCAIDNSIKESTDKLKIIFFGGEPTLNMDLIKFCVDYANNLEIPAEFQISTNGVVSEEKLNYLIDNDFGIQISADGVPKIQNKQRPVKDGSGSAKDVEETISFLTEREYPFKIRMTVTNHNLDHLLESIRYYGKLEVEYIHIESVSSSGGYNNNLYTELDSKKFAEKMIQALDEAKEFGMRIINSAYMNISEPTTRFCGALCGNQIVLTPDGKVSTCYEVQDYCHPSSDSLIIGEYNSDTDEIEINQSKVDKLKKVSTDKLKKCEDCFVKFICGGGCPIRNGLLDSEQLEDSCDQTRYIIYHLIKRIYKSN